MPDRKYICTQCTREQPGEEFQCECGNLDPVQFEEKDIYHEPANKAVDNSDAPATNDAGDNLLVTPTEPPKTMVEKAPHVELKSKVEEKETDLFKTAKKKKKKKRK